MGCSGWIRGNWNKSRIKDKVKKEEYEEGQGKGKEQGDERVDGTE